jgi:hypothetical protein
MSKWDGVGNSRRNREFGLHLPVTMLNRLRMLILEKVAVVEWSRGLRHRTSTASDSENFWV